MDSTLTLLLSYLLLYKYIALFLIMLVAAIILPLPTDTLLIAIGAFSFQGYFSFWISFIVALTANVLGDYIDFYIAKRYEHVVAREKYIQKYSFFTKLEAFYKQYTGLTIFITRFIGILAPLTNFLAGFEQTQTSTFLFYDIFGNAIDTGMLLMIGYVIGDNWENVSNKIGAVGILITLVVIVGFTFSVILRKKLTK